MASYVFVWSKNRADIRDGNEYKIWKWLVLKFHDSGHLQIILHLNKITECLKMTTFKIVFTLDGFFSAETTCTARWHVFYIRNRHISVSSFVYKYDQWPHERKSWCLRGRRHSLISYSPSGFFSQLLVSSGFYFWNVNRTPMWHLSKMFKVAFKDVSTKNSEPTYWTILFVMLKIYFIKK
jgi:hypothetical protein